jgi:RNA polymerase sigma-70 factor (ECF subfamily)
MTVGDVLVLERAHEADDAAFQAIFSEFQDRIYNCVYRLMGNAEDANDLTQETFLRAYSALPKIQGELKVVPWLYLIATNLCMDQLRRRKLIRWEPWDLFTSIFHPRQVARDNPEHDAVLSESRAQVQVVLEKLSPKYRMCLVLREYDGLSCQEIADIMGTTRSAVKSLLFRAREEFRQVYQKMEPAPAV